MRKKKICLKITATISVRVSSLTTSPVDFALTSPHNHMIQLLKINLCKYRIGGVSLVNSCYSSMSSLPKL